MQVHTPESVVGNLASPANYVRFFIHELFPALSRIVYVDVDVVFQADVRELWDLAAEGGKVLAAVGRPMKYRSVFDTKVRFKYRRRYGKDLRLASDTFNAGIFVLDLDLYRAGSFLGEALWWIEENTRSKLWRFGSQPPMLVIFHEQWHNIPKRWNVDGKSRGVLCAGRGPGVAGSLALVRLLRPC